MKPTTVFGAALLGAVIGLVGCGVGGTGKPIPKPPADPCYVPPTSDVVYGDCGAKMADGTECVAECGQLPQDGSPGTLLPAGCQVQIGTSTPETGTCVASCSDCH